MGMKVTAVTDEYVVWETPRFKYFRSSDYQFNFSKLDGEFWRWGKTLRDDPDFSPFGPEIADIEISIDGCPNNCPWCVPPGFEVIASNGLRQIQNLTIEDRVKGGEENEWQSVEQVHQRHYEGSLVCIQLENDVYIELTPEHPVKTANRGWVSAGELVETDDIAICDAD